MIISCEKSLWNEASLRPDENISGQLDRAQLIVWVGGCNCVINLFSFVAFNRVMRWNTFESFILSLVYWKLSLHSLSLTSYCSELSLKLHFYYYYSLGFFLFKIYNLLTDFFYEAKDCVVNVRRTRKTIRVPDGIWTHDPPWSSRRML